MASSGDTEFFDIYNFELLLRERINELQWKSDSLEAIEKELSETRRILYETQSQLEDERRKSMQLEMELKTTTETTKALEDDNTRNHAEQVRTKLKYESALMERNVLIDRARTVRLENMDLKIKIQEYERNLTSTKMVNENLEASLMELKNNVSRLHARIHNNVGKLEREQEKLRKSFEESMKFGQRVQATLKNNNAARQRDERTIEELKKRIVEREKSPRSVPPEVEGIRSLELRMESTLKELRIKLESDSLEKKLSLLCNELCKMDKIYEKD